MEQNEEKTIKKIKTRAHDDRRAHKTHTHTKHTKTRPQTLGGESGMKNRNVLPMPTPPAEIIRAKLS